MAEKPVVQRVKSLSNGVSRQAETIRYPNQVADAKNVSFSVLRGAVRRPGSTHVATLTGGIAAQAGYGMHLIERDDEEQYAIIYGAGVLKVVNLADNSEATVNIMGSGGAYLNIGSPTVDDFRFLTIGDTTFIANRRVSTGMLDEYAFDPSSMPHQLVRTSSSPLTFRFGPVPWTERNFVEQEFVSTYTSAGGWFRPGYRGTGTKDSGGPDYNTSSNVKSDVKASNFLSGTYGNGMDQKLESIDTIGSGKVICTFGPLNVQPIMVEISPDVIQDNDGASTLSEDGSTVNRAQGEMFYITSPVGGYSPDISSYVTVNRGNNDRNPGIAQYENGMTPFETWLITVAGSVLAFQDTLVFQGQTSCSISGSNALQQCPTLTRSSCRSLRTMLPTLISSSHSKAPYWYLLSRAGSTSWKTSLCSRLQQRIWSLRLGTKHRAFGQWHLAQTST